MSKLDEMLERDARIREIQAQITMSRTNMGLWLRFFRWIWRKITIKSTVICFLFVILCALLYFITIVITGNPIPLIVALLFVSTMLFGTEFSLAIIKGVVWLLSKKHSKS